jgi:outer membrane lipoprotein-sorting protein
MKKYLLLMCICLVSSVAFCQSQEPAAREKAKPAQTQEISAAQDTTLTDKKAIVNDTKKKKPKRDRSHKECSRMKS